MPSHAGTSKPETLRAGWRALQDADYEKAGARIASAADAFGQDIVLKVRPPDAATEVGHFKEGAK